MLIVLLGWLFAAFCLLPIGSAVLMALSRPEERELRNVPLVHVLLCGFIAATAFGQCWAYLAPVGRGIDLVLSMVALVILFAQRTRLAAYMRHRFELVRAWSWPVQLGLVALFAIVLLKSASPSEMYDEGGYYMPYIKWIERYRIVPGLGNIEDRMGFNSAFHLASALFGMAWLVPGGTYDLNGLLLLAFGAWCLGGVARLSVAGVPAMSDVMKAFGLFFLMRNMLTSASADLSNILLGEAILLLLMEKIEARTVAVGDRTYLLIGLYAVMVATIKLSSLSIWLAPAYLTVRILRSGPGSAFVRLAVAAALVLLPWLGRFPILSGYWVYPLYQLGGPAVDWKVPEAVAERQYHYVSEFAKTNARPGESAYFAAHRGLLEWVPAWFHRENGSNKATALAMGFALLVLVPFAVMRARWLWREHRELLLFGALVVVNVLCWFLRNPSFRFGWAWAIALLAFAFHLALSRLAGGKVLRWATLGLLALFTVQNTGKTVLESRPYLAHMLVRPMPVKQVILKEVDLGGIRAQASATNQCWGTVPPCLPLGYDPRLRARGPRVEDGFRIAGKP